VSEAGGALELTDEARVRVRELQEIANRAEGGEAGAREELRAALRKSAPEVIARCSNTARIYRRVLAERASGGNLLVEEAIRERATLMAAEIAGENPTPLEVLLSERIASLWVLTELQEALLAAYYGGAAKNLPPSYLLQMAKLQESAGRRYLAAIKTLAQVRKTQVGTPSLQVNTQINLPIAYETREDGS
jgi:hypothetical protein